MEKGGGVFLTCSSLVIGLSVLWSFYLQSPVGSFEIWALAKLLMVVLTRWYSFNWRIITIYFSHNMGGVFKN